jgi:benzylsuccinate CoA-transferase BbsF subunit
MPALFAGIRVLELGAGAAGPVATRYFADHGATVVKVESATRPDFMRLVQYRKDDPRGLDAQPLYVLMNPNKRNVSINLSRPEGVELVRRLVDWADIVAENFSPRAMAKWGLDWESLRRRKPGLIMVSSCLFGQTGPQRDYPGFGGQGSALAGFNFLTGWSDRAAVGPHGTITDSLSPRYVACLLSAALLHRERTGEGQYLDVAQIETGVYSLSEVIVRYSARGEVMARQGNRCEHAAPHGIYPCRGEDRWIAIAIFSDVEWRLLRRLMGNPPFGQDPRFATAAGRLEHVDELDRHVAEWTRGCDASELMERLQRAGIEAGVAQDLEQLNRDPQLEHRGHFRELRHEHLGAVRFENYAIRLAESPPEIRTPGPHLGQHTREVLGEYLGLSDAEIDRLAAAGVLT